MALDLDASDTVVLDTCHVEGERLHDHLTGTMHAVNSPASRILGLLDGRHRVGEVLASAGVGSTSEVRSYIDRLDEAGFVRVRRHWPSRLHPACAPTLPPPARRRWPATPRGVTAAVLWSGRSLLGAGAVISVVLAGLMPSLAAVVPLALVGFGLLTTAIHELGHLGALRAVGLAAPFVSASRGRVAVAHRGAGGARLRIVAVAGPITAAATALVAALMAATAVPVARSLALATGVLLAIGHLASLAPVFEDGRHLWGRHE